MGEESAAAGGVASSAGAQLLLCLDTKLRGHCGRAVLSLDINFCSDQQEGCVSGRENCDATCREFLTLMGDSGTRLEDQATVGFLYEKHHHQSSGPVFSILVCLCTSSSTSFTATCSVCIPASHHPRSWLGISCSYWKMAG